jgi:VWFA-related protein
LGGIVNETTIPALGNLRRGSDLIRILHEQSRAGIMRTNPRDLPSGGSPKTLRFTIIVAICFFFAWSGTRGQTPTTGAPSPKTPQTETSQETPEVKKPSEEIVSSDAPTTFKLRVNLILVRVVVRDANGQVVKNLKKEDFRLADNHKPQVISSFSVETSAVHTGDVKAEAQETKSVGTSATMPVLPQGFIALFFDDLQLSASDVINSRQAAIKVLASLREDYRVAVFTSSGQVEQDFTADRAKLDLAIQRITPNTQGSVEDCMPPSVYLANLIVELNDSSALAAAMKACGPEDRTRAVAQNILSFGEDKVRRGFQSMDAVIRRMGRLPGQRTIVLLSPGFVVPSSIHESGELIDQATKANIIINAIDVRGLYTSSSRNASTSSSYANLAVSAHDLTQYINTGERVQDDILGELADGTGGLFFHDRNDIQQGLVRATAEPEVSYVLGFTPENLKLDGKYHQLKVTLANNQNWTLQARHGYFAPHGEANPELEANQELVQAVFSQVQIQDFPMQCQAQFFHGTDGFHVTVLARIETNTLKFRKEQDGNRDNLTVITAIFDESGNLIDGRQRIIEMNLKETTRQRLATEGLKINSSFNLPPGSYVIRIVARDSEGAQMASLNHGLVVP